MVRSSFKGIQVVFFGPELFPLHSLQVLERQSLDNFQALIWFVEVEGVNKQWPFSGIIWWLIPWIS